MALDELTLPRPKTRTAAPPAGPATDSAPARKAERAPAPAPTDRPTLIKAPQELRLKAVNRRKGLELVLTAEVRSRMQTVITEATAGFEAEVLGRLAELRHLLTGLANDDFARIFLMPQLEELALDIKGMAGTFGYELLSDLAKSLQDFLAGLNMPSGAEFEIVAIHIDALYLLLNHRVNGQGGEMERQLLISLGYATDKIATHINPAN